MTLSWKIHCAANVYKGYRSVAILCIIVTDVSYSQKAVKTEFLQGFTGLHKETL